MKITPRLPSPLLIGSPNRKDAILVEAPSSSPDSHTSHDLPQLLETMHFHVLQVCNAVKQAPPPTSRALVFPAFSEQERTLRTTLDKLVKVEQSLETNYTCLACLNIFDNPVTCVPCGHTYCKRCLQSGMSGSTLLCHECGDVPVSSFIEALNLDKLACKFGFKLSALQDLQALCGGEEINVPVDDDFA